MLPILDSIISREGCSLKLLEFPKKWREEASAEFIDFLERYNEMWNNRFEPFLSRCAKCKRNILEHDTMLNYGWVATEGEEIGLDETTCSACLKHYCDQCNDFDYVDFEDILLFICGNCDKSFCVECSAVKICNCCDFLFCTDCHFMVDRKCAGSQCNENVCDSCVSNKQCIFAVMMSVEMK